MDNRKPSVKATPLIIASNKGHEDIVKLLLEQPTSDKKTTCSLGFTALMHACSEEHIKVVEAFLDTRVDVNATVRETNVTAFTMACSNQPIRSLLSSHGAIDHKTKTCGKVVLPAEYFDGHNYVY